MSQQSLDGREGPWPFPDPLWPDPPWEMEGKVLTAWFHVDPALLANLAHPDFPPNPDGRQTRLRFYDIEAQADGRSIRFSEAVVAYKTEFEGVAGELSALMWTDSLRYLAWGREIFGWPLRLGEIQLTSGLWEGDHSEPAGCYVGDLSMTSVRIESESFNKASEPPTWITPHRSVDATEPGVEKRRVYAVRPRTISVGRTYACSGVLDVGSLFGHVVDAELDFVSGVRIMVGADVESIQ